MNTIKDYGYTLHDLTQIFNVSKSVIYGWIKYHDFPEQASNIKGKHLWDKSIVKKWSANNEYLWKKKTRNLKQKNPYFSYGQNLPLHRS